MSVPSAGQGINYTPSISSYVLECLQRFEALVAARNLISAQKAVVASHLARLKVWAGSLGAHRVSGSRSLEYRLRDASSIRRHIISLLHGLSGLLAKALNDNGPLSVKPLSDDLDEELARYLVDEQGSDTRSDLDQLLESIGGVVDCLLRLSVVIGNPAPHDQFKARAGERLDFYAPWDVQHVRDKFSGLDVRMSERLGKALTQRRQYFRYREEHHERLRSGIDTLPGFNFDEKTTVASSLPEHLKDAPNLDLSMTDVLDSRDDRSDASLTSFAASNADSDALRVPPIPKAYVDGPFLCPFCQTMISIDSRHAWKKHVFRDLRPYVCLADDCPTPHILYRRRHEWIRHTKGHWSIWKCPFDCPATLSSADDFRSHIHAEHADKVPLDRVGTLETLSSYPNTAQIPENCPLCFETKLGTEKLYESHVGGHLEQLSLFSLPPTEDRDDSEGGESEKGSRDSDTDNSEDGLLAVDAAKSSPNVRCKLYELRDNDWFDLGTGHCHVGSAHDYDPQVLTVMSEAEPYSCLLYMEITKRNGLQKQQETLLVWMDPNTNKDMAISFQEEEGCQKIWRLVSKITDRLPP